MSDTFIGDLRKEDTIYRDEKGFDDRFKIDIDFAKMEFKEILNSSEASSIFYIHYFSKPRVLKVVCTFVRFKNVRSQVRVIFPNQGRCSSIMMEILGTPPTAFETLIARAVRSEPTVVLSGPKYGMLVLCQISTALC